MSAQVHAIRVHSQLCLLWDELWNVLEQRPKGRPLREGYPRPSIEASGNAVILSYPESCSYRLAGDGQAICQESGRSEDVTTPEGVFAVAYDLVKFLTGNRYAAQLKTAGERVLSF